jgi:hypothetical protein
MEFVGKFSVAVALKPIVVVKMRADFGHRVAQRSLKIRGFKVDRHNFGVADECCGSDCLYTRAMERLVHLLLHFERVD